MRDGRSIGAQIIIVPREDVRADQAMNEVQEIMRIRHGLKLDEPNDFDVVRRKRSCDLRPVHAGRFLALVVISSIALMVGGIGVMAIMMISVTSGRGRSA